MPCCLCDLPLWMEVIPGGQCQGWGGQSGVSQGAKQGNHMRGLGTGGGGAVLGVRVEYLSHCSQLQLLPPWHPIPGQRWQRLHIQSPADREVLGGAHHHI